MKIRTLLLLFGTLISSLPAAVSAQSPAYTSITAQISEFTSSPYIRMVGEGKTVTGRKIPSYLLTNFNKSSVNKARILIVSGQHGNEINPIKSVISLSINLINESYPEILSESLLLFVPIANPDGLYSASRYNSLGVDINRSWLSLETSENQFVHSMITTFRPQLIIDVHEWKEATPLPGNSVEVAWSGAKDQQESMALIASKIHSSAKLSKINCSHDATQSLMHRRYTRLGYAAYLLETDYRLPFSEKEKMYHRACLAAITQLNGNKNLRTSISPSSSGWNVSDMEIIAGNLQGRISISNKMPLLLWSLAPCIGCYLILVFIRPKKKPSKPLRQWKFTQQTIIRQQSTSSGHHYRAR